MGSQIEAGQARKAKTRADGAVVTCPNCKHGLIYGLLVAIKCNICDGTGVLPANIVYDPERGQKLRQKRMAKEQGLRAYCKEYRLNAVEVSEMERGFFRTKEVVTCLFTTNGPIDPVTGIGGCEDGKCSIP